MAFDFIPEYPVQHRANACICCSVQRRVPVPWSDSGERLINLGIWVDTTTNEQGQPVFMEVPAVICETCVRELASMIGFKEQPRVEFIRG